MKVDNGQGVNVVSQTSVKSQPPRFAFGKNWRNFLEHLNEDRIVRAGDSLCEISQQTDFRGARFLDAGSGSGLFSLAAYRKGATVTSFDYDEESVRCTQSLKKKFAKDDDRWKCIQGSVLNETFMLSLNEFDIVYSWGVLHHTGDLWKALENASKAVSPDGKLIISIYNDQGWLSKYWRNIKLIYIQASFLRPFLIMLHAPYLVVMRYLVRAITGRVKLERGMSYWHDMLDWLGGYPFEVAKPEEVIYFVHKHGFSLRKLKTCGGRSGCNEFVFERTA